MRGEDVVGSLSLDLSVGSPPHARGRQVRRRLPKRGRRITPACAGKTSVAARISPINQGSPPHARGRPRGGRRTWVPRSDHPRMRGEDPPTPSGIGEVAGSPPHARGRRTPAWHLSFRFRITPACAGKTQGRHGRAICRSDHPRMRGEDAGTARSSNMSIGSPPHARGRLVALNFKNSFERITPACAGKTLFATASSCWVTDHPRMRGEDA